MKAHVKQMLRKCLSPPVSQKVHWSHLYNNEEMRIIPGRRTLLCSNRPDPSCQHHPIIIIIIYSYEQVTHENDPGTGYPELKYYRLCTKLIPVTGYPELKYYTSLLSNEILDSVDLRTTECWLITTVEIFLLVAVQVYHS